MNRIPAVGERVHYVFDHHILGHRECTGTVRKIYEGLNEGGYVAFKDDPEAWHAAIEVDAPLPEWWSYPGTNRFAPSITELEPLA